MMWVTGQSERQGCRGLQHRLQGNGGADPAERFGRRILAHRRTFATGGSVDWLYLSACLISLRCCNIYLVIDKIFKRPGRYNYLLCSS